MEIFDEQRATDIAEPPDYEARIVLTCGTTGVHAVVGACFGLWMSSWKDEAPNVTLYWYIKNLTDNDILLQGTINKDNPNANLSISRWDLRGKTIELKLWNPNQDNVGKFAIQAHFYTCNP